MGKFDLTKAQKEILNLLIFEKLTPDKISSRRKTSNQNTHRIIRTLIKKGFINKHNTRYSKTQCTPTLTTPLVNTKNPQKIRLHGQEFNIQIITSSKKFSELKRNSNLEIIKGHTIRLYKNSIEVYCDKLLFFYGHHPQDSTSKSFEYWISFFEYLEDIWDITILKHRYENIKLVKSHYGHVGDPLAKDSIKSNIKIQIRAKEDGKVWALVDNSFNLEELETVHSDTSKPDMENIINLYQDLRHEDTDLPSVTKKILNIFGDNLIKLSEHVDNNAKTVGLALQEINLIISLIKHQYPERGFTQDHLNNMDKGSPDYVG